MYAGLLCLTGYLLGSIPTAYLVARWVKGIDLRRYGSGTVSGSMIYEHTHRWLVMPVGLFDVAKGAFPAWLALRLGFGEAVAAAAGLAAVIGHNWPIYLGFTGGRGLSTILGLLLVLFPWGDLWLLAFLGVGFALGDSAPWALASLLGLPILIWRFDGSPTLYWMTGAMVLITLVKRLEANRRPLPVSKKERWLVIWRRLIFDRDIQDHQAWIRRRL